MNKNNLKVTNPQPGYKSLELKGQRFGMLIVISQNGINKNGNKVWKCLCDCGNECFTNSTRLRSGKSDNCGKHKRRGSDIHNYSGYKDISGTKWNSVVNNAKIRGLSLNITKEFIWDLLLKQDNKCYFTGVEITFKDKTASIDRIDNNIGYEEDNVVMVHKRINVMRGNLTVDDFINICKLVGNNNSLLKKEIPNKCSNYSISKFNLMGE